MSHEFYNFQTLEQGSAKMVEIIKELYSDLDPKRLVSPPVLPGFLRNTLPQNPPEKGCSIEEIFEETKNKIYPGIMLWQCPRYFGYFPSTIAVTNVFAEMFATTFHSPAFNYALSPSHTELQNITVDWSAIALGLPQKFLLKNTGGSIINTSTTESVLVTIHTAKRRKMEEYKMYENKQLITKLVGYFGQFGFVGNERGLKLKQIFYTRAVPVKYSEKEQNFILDFEKFEEIVESDVKEGLIPFWYGATYGTTFSAANDVNKEMIRICKKYGMWINVDAAYLGSSWICEECRPDMSLFEEVDSLTVNFSKVLFLGNGGSLLFIGNKKELTRSMGAEISFSFFKNQYSGLEDVVDYKDWMLGLNRRNNSLKFFYLFKHYGLEKLREYIRFTIRRSEHLEKQIIESKIFKMFSKPQLGLVCFQLCDKNGAPSSELTKKLGQKIKNISEGFMSPGVFKQHYILRIAIGNPSNTIPKIEAYYSKIKEQGLQILEDSK